METGSLSLGFVEIVPFFFLDMPNCARRKAFFPCEVIRIQKYFSLSQDKCILLTSPDIGLLRTQVLLTIGRFGSHIWLFRKEVPDLHTLEFKLQTKKENVNIC